MVPGNIAMGCFIVLNKASETNADSALSVLFSSIKTKNPNETTDTCLNINLIILKREKKESGIYLLKTD